MESKASLKLRLLTGLAFGVLFWGAAAVWGAHPLFQ